MTESHSRAKNSNHPSAGDPSFDLMFKVLIIGNAGVGKTATIFRYCDNTFVSGYVSTVGIDFKVKNVARQEKRVKLQIWDTAGQERFRSITHAYYRGAMGFLLMFDLTNEDSFTSVREWATQVKELSGDLVSVVLVGNKCDLEDSRSVSADRASAVAEQLGFPYVETSAKDGTNVKEAFELLTDLICQRMADITDDTLPPGVDARQAIPQEKGAESSTCMC